MSKNKDEMIVKYTLMPLNDDTLKQFKRYSKFYL
mgnify:CR=1 FL=1